MRQTKNKKRGSRYRIPFSTRPTDQQTGDDEGERKDIRYKMMMMMTTLEACQLSGSSI
jgi:hypothetical protein